VPPARIPGEHGEQLDDLPNDVKAICAALLFDRQRQVDRVARLVARHLTVGHSTHALIATLAHALLREDAGFHARQMLEAGVRQFTVWANTEEGRNILIAVARYLAAIHRQNARRCRRPTSLGASRSGELHQEEVASS
jgi:hypothetical protein